MSDFDSAVVRELRDPVALLRCVEMTAEVHPRSGDGSGFYEAKVVDVVRIGDKLHFVVVLDD